MRETASAPIGGAPSTPVHRGPSGVLARLARTCFRRRWLVVGLWVALLVALSGLGATLGGDFVNDFSVSGSESEEATELLEAGGLGQQGGFTGQVVFGAKSVDGGIDDPRVEAAMESLFADITAEVGVDVRSPYSPDGNGQVSPDGDVAVAQLQFGDVSRDDAVDSAEDVRAVRAAADLPDGLDVELGGELFFVESEPSSEVVGVLGAMVIMLVAFGSVFAMGLPIVTAFFGIGVGASLVMLVANGVDIPDFAPAAVMLISIGVGIDYALLIVTRYRDELGAGTEPEGAVVRALATAGRAVFFAGATVVVALVGLMASGIAVFQSLAVATTAGVSAVMLATLTLVPALLGFAGRSVDRLSVHRRSSDFAPGAGFWSRWSRVVQRRPGFVTLVVLALLLLLASPVFGMRLGFADAGNQPEGDTTRAAYDMVSESFGPGRNGPLVFAVDLSDVPADDVGGGEGVVGGGMDDGAGDGAQQAVFRRLTTALEAEGLTVAGPPVVNASGALGVVQAFPATAPQDTETTDTVRHLRDEVLPDVVAGTSAEVKVGGMAAATVDFTDVQESRFPVFILAVLLVSFLLLMLMFRSPVVAGTAVVMNLVSIGAAYGAIVAVFQWGWGAGVLGTGEPGPIEAWSPMMLFAITFGLSSDYEVFLISRIREERARSGSTRQAIGDGLAKTARVITAAAAIMVCVSAGFVLSDERSVQIFGLGLAVAILVDATLVRTLLVPAVMELLGERNWWVPGWLNRVLLRFDIDGGPPSLPESDEPGTDVGVQGVGRAGRTTSEADVVSR